MGGETQTCIMVEGRRLICNLDGFSVIPSLPFVLFTQDSNNFHGAVVASLGTGCGRPLHIDFLSLFSFGLTRIYFTLLTGLCYVDKLYVLKILCSCSDILLYCMCFALCFVPGWLFLVFSY